MDMFFSDGRAKLVIANHIYWVGLNFILIVEHPIIESVNLCNMGILVIS